MLYYVPYMYEKSRKLQSVVGTPRSKKPPDTRLIQYKIINCFGIYFVFDDFIIYV